jgi:sugar-specific transcriptional regulator TrmB
MEKGFVSFITKNKKKLFSASDPEVLGRLIDEKEQEIKNLKSEFSSSLKQMKELKASEENQKVMVYTGIKGVQNIFEDILNNHKEYWNYSTRNTFARIMPKFREYFREMRIAKKIKQRMIIADNERKPNRPYQEKRYVPKEFSSPIGIQGYGDKVAIIVWDSEPPVAIVLEGKKVSNAFKGIFENMWKSAKK